MWLINSFEAENFFSHKSTKYSIVNNVLTMIYGQNTDIDKKKSNGSGKSVLLDIISFSLTGDCLRKLKSSKKMIANGEKECMVIINLENKVLKSTLQIKRTLSQKSSQKIEITFNGDLQKQLADLHPRESEKFIEEKLGISFDDITNYFLISKYKYSSLFLATDSAKKEVINRFSKADIIDNIFPHIDKDLDLHNHNLSALNESLIKSKTTVEVYEKQLIVLMNEQSESKKAEEIEDIKKNIEQKKTAILDLKILIKEITAEIASSNVLIEDKKKLLIEDSELKKHDKTISDNQTLLENKRTEYKNVREKEEVKKFDKIILDNRSLLENKRTEYRNIRDKYKNDFSLIDTEEINGRTIVKGHEDKIKEYHKIVIDLEKYIAGEIECPKCNHHFILADKSFDVEDAKKKVVEYNLLKSEQEGKLTEANKFQTKIREKRDVIEGSIKKDQTTIQSEADKIKNEIDSLENQLETTVKNYQTTIQSEADKIKKEIEALEIKASDLSKANNTILTEISVKEREVKSKEQSIQLHQDKIGYESKHIDQYLLVIEEIKNAKKDDSIDIHKKKIEDESENRVKLQTEIDSLTEKISKINEWILKFKRFKSFLANGSLSDIQNQSNYFLQKMKSDITVFLDGYRELANGKLKEEITVELSRDGINGEEFGAFSGGEKSQSDLSSILAMQSIINSASSSGGLGFLAIDEILESVDEIGMDQISKCLNSLGQTILLIAHSQPSESIDCNKIVVCKEHGISKIL